MKRWFERNPEAIFSLPNQHIVMFGVKVEQNENGTHYKYQDITLQYYECKIESIWGNTTKYINMILEALTERFGDLSKGNDLGEDKSGTAITGDSILHDVCWVLDSQKWIVPEDMAITLEAVNAVLEKNIESISKIFDHLTQMFKKISPTITIETIIDKYISLVMYAMKNYNHLIYTQLKMWQLLNPFKNERGWNDIFLIAELCFCVPCSNASLERFFSQMRIAKTDWRNSLSESNLTSLLQIKVSGPTDKLFCKSR